MEFIWIDINTDLPKDGEFVIIWQENLADSECSRFQRARFADYGDVKNIGQLKIFEVYPIVYREEYHSSKNYIGEDLEGDQVKITHWSYVPKT